MRRDDPELGKLSLAHTASCDEPDDTPLGTLLVVPVADVRTYGPVAAIALAAIEHLVTGAGPGGTGQLLYGTDGKVWWAGPDEQIADASGLLPESAWDRPKDNRHTTFDALFSIAGDGKVVEFDRAPGAPKGWCAYRSRRMQGWTADRAKGITPEELKSHLDREFGTDRLNRP